MFSILFLKVKGESFFFMTRFKLIVAFPGMFLKINSQMCKQFKKVIKINEIETEKLK